MWFCTACANPPDLGKIRKNVAESERVEITMGDSIRKLSLRISDARAISRIVNSLQLSEPISRKADEVAVDVPFAFEVKFYRNENQIEHLSLLGTNLLVIRRGNHVYWAKATGAKADSSYLYEVLAEQLADAHFEDLLAPKPPPKETNDID